MCMFIKHSKMSDFISLSEPSSWCDLNLSVMCILSVQHCFNEVWITEWLHQGLWGDAVSYDAINLKLRCKWRREEWHLCWQVQTQKLGNFVWYENECKISIQVCSSMSGNEWTRQQCIVTSSFFVHCRLNPCSNLGYLVLISLAHCHSYCCGWVQGYFV